MRPPVIHSVEQRSPEWHSLRCGMITSSCLGELITSAGKIANNGTSRALLADLLAQRITGHVGQGFETLDMMRGVEDEPIARHLYEQRYAPVRQVGFVTREIADCVTIGCSPDGLVGDDGGIEIKSRKPKIQIGTIVSGAVPPENMIQIQASMLVTGRAWWDYVSYSGGLPLAVIRVHADAEIHSRITEAAASAERTLADMRAAYEEAIKRNNWSDTEPVAREIEI